MDLVVIDLRLDSTLLPYVVVWTRIFCPDLCPPSRVRFVWTLIFADIPLLCFINPHIYPYPDRGSWTLNPTIFDAVRTMAHRLNLDLVSPLFHEPSYVNAHSIRPVSINVGITSITTTKWNYQMHMHRTVLLGGEGQYRTNTF